jgi:cytidine deaminase
MRREALIARARAAALRAYAPYSGFRVGAALVVEDASGLSVVTGANVENASYGLTLCAERAALAAALTSRSSAARGPHPAAGEDARPRILQLAVACIDVPDDAPASQRTPCGACRQWLAELAPDATYYIDGIPGALRLDDLLPLAFRLNGGAPA